MSKKENNIEPEEDTLIEYGKTVICPDDDMFYYTRVDSCGFKTSYASQNFTPIGWNIVR